MTAVSAGSAGRAGTERGWMLVGGIVLACLTEAIASTAMALSRGDVIGDTYATADEFAWLDMSYVALKLIGFGVTPWLLTRVPARQGLLIATSAMGVACAAALLTSQLEALVVLRAIQGLAGAALLVCGQTILFTAYPRARQPLLQAVFAVGSVVAPATLTPALQGWLVDSQSWLWIFFSILPVSLLAAGLVILSKTATDQLPAPRSLDWPGGLLLATALFSLTYLLSRGNRWNWFDEDRIVWLSLAAGISTLLFFVRAREMGARALLDPGVFRTDDFTFAFVVSFVAGAALFGSAFLIPAFAQSALAFTPTDAGDLLLDGSIPFIGTLLLAAALMQQRGLPPVATVPFGILLIMAAMWMLSGSTLESGREDMQLAILLRAFGLGFLFLSITLIAFSRLSAAHIPFGIGIFNIGRQLGGLMGVAGLQTVIDHESVANQAILGAAAVPGAPAVAERLATLTSILIQRGMDPASAPRAASAMLGRAFAGQASVIAFNTAFAAVTLFFMAAVPFVVATKILLARTAARRKAAGSEAAQ